MITIHINPTETNQCEGDKIGGQEQNTKCGLTEYWTLDNNN